MKTPLRFPRVLFALLFAVLLPVALHAGPPLICHPYAIGPDAKSLPGGGKDHFGLSAAYDRTQLVKDTLALLNPAMPIIVRMETLRRAALYATNEMSAWRTPQGSYAQAERDLALGLLHRLRERTQDPVFPRDLALFDLGFYAETLRQTKLDPALDGYALLAKVAELRPADADVQFALALASVWSKRKAHTAHLDSALAGAKPGTLLATNLRTHFQR